MINADLIARAKALSCTDLIRPHWTAKQFRALAGPCPKCGGTDRFGISRKKNLWNCRGCQGGGDAIALAQLIHGTDFPTAVEILTGERDQPKPYKSVVSHAYSQPESEPDQGQDTAYALRYWHGAASGIRGTPAELHFLKRKIDVDQLPHLGEVLRWHPACVWGGGRQGCMVALYTDAVTGEPKAIHRTAITPAGEKVDRKALGPIAGCVIRLWPDECVTEGLVLGEGIETTLAAATNIEHRETLLQPAWATTTASLMAKMPVLAGIEALTILVDKDARAGGEKAAAECSARWTAAGREVIRLVPRKVGTDFNDLVRAGGLQ
jgi:hypothetical protein